MSLKLPRQVDLFGVPVSATTVAEATDCVIAAAKAGRALAVDFMPVHGLMLAAEGGDFGAALQRFDLVCPDGQPVRWALNHFHRCGLTSRVYGPDTMLAVCERAQAEELPVYCYGSREIVLEALGGRLRGRFPRLRFAGLESPPFRELTEEEEQAAVARIKESGAKICLVGLGCPKQELWAARHVAALAMPVLCVGAAFDFHAGLLDQAPPWLQRCGLEWLYRLLKEPRRLLHRYTVYNSKFLWVWLKRSLGAGRSRHA